MLVLDFQVDYRPKILKGISVEHMKCLNEDLWKKEKAEKKKYDAFVHPQLGILKSLFAPKCSTSSMSFMDSVVIFYRPLMNMSIQLGYSRGVYKLHCYV